MKVKDVMDSSPLWIEDDTSIKKLARLIFTTNIIAFPVLRNKKVVGFIAEEDIFLNLYQISIGKNKQLIPKTFLEKPVRDIMIKNVLTISPDTEILDAERIMYKNYFANLPVVDENNELLGMVKHGDLFREILKDEIPGLEAEQYASFILENYDQMVDWEKRFDLEFPTLFRIFAKKNVEKVLKLGLRTGKYATELARNGLVVTSITQNSLTVGYAREEASKLPADVKKRLDFKVSDYKDLSKKFKPSSFDAALCIGGTLPYLPEDPGKIISDVKKIIKKNGAFIVQLLNLERVVEDKNRFLYFKIKGKDGKEELYVEFFDKRDENALTHNIIHFESSGGRWLYRGINSIDIKYLKNNEIKPLFEKAGFKEVMVTGNKGEYRGQFGQMSLIKPFDPKTSEWMTVIAYT